MGLEVSVVDKCAAWNLWQVLLGDSSSTNSWVLEYSKLCWEETEKVGLKLNIQKTKMAYSPITSWQIDGERVETVADFIFWGFKITADGDCSHDIKRHSLEGKLWPT